MDTSNQIQTPKNTPVITQTKPTIPQKSKLKRDFFSSKKFTIGFFITLLTAISLLIEIPNKLVTSYEKVSEVATKKIPTPTTKPTVTTTPVPTIFNTTPTIEPTVQPPFLATNLGEGGRICGYIYIIPSNIDPSQNIITSINEVSLWDKASLFIAADMRLEESNNQLSFQANRQVSNTSKDSSWIQVNNPVTMQIQVANAPSHTNYLEPTYGGCGGGGIIRRFPTVSLTAEKGDYTTRTKYPDFDFFSLKPGEFEYFNFTFSCSHPGIYKVTPIINYIYNGKNYTAETPTKKSFLCPNSFTIWRAPEHFETKKAYTFTKEGTYTWDGTRYKKQ